MNFLAKYVTLLARYVILLTKYVIFLVQQVNFLIRKASALLPQMKFGIPGLILISSLFVNGCSQQAVRKTDVPAITASTLVADLKQQLAKDPNNPELHYKLGYAFIGQAEKSKSAADRKDAIREFRKVLQLVPGNENTLIALYNIYYDDVVKGNNKSLEKARAIFSQLSNPARANLNPPSLAHFLQLYIAQKDAPEKNPDELFDALLSATREQPGSDKAYIQLAKMYRTRGYYPLAIATLKQGENNQAQSRELYQALAETYEGRAEANGCTYEHGDSLYSAATYYQKAIPLATDKPELHFQLAQMFIDNNHYPLALNEIAIVLELAPSAANFAWAAQSYSMMGHEQQALELLDKAKQQGLAASDTAYHEIYMNSGNWMQAAMSFTEYLQAQPEISIYDAIKADIIRDQTEFDFTKITRNKKITVRNEWEGAVYAYWTEKINRQQFEKAASNRCELTEYYFYSGYRDFRAGKTRAAKQLFNAALQQNTYRFIERPLASHFLERD